jgi:hypothetical protein
MAERATAAVAGDTGIVDFDHFGCFNGHVIIRFRVGGIIATEDPAATSRLGSKRRSG